MKVCKCEAERRSATGRTGHSSIVGDEAGHVDVLVVYPQVLHAAHKLTVANRKILWEFGDSSKEQGTSEVQRPETTEPTVTHSLLTRISEIF